ncbi:MAG: replicative DNA helicase, partial [Flavobacteriaceae bacterium]|nr:replicative DNA helicase [Flavobacteriaceae bacterium]
MNNQAKIPPQALDLEKAILGALLIDKKAMIDVAEFIFEDVFYETNHQIIYNAIKKLFTNNTPIDLLTVSDELNKKGKLKSIGGDFYLVKLTQLVASSANIEYHSRILLQKFIQRELIH